MPDTILVVVEQREGKLNRVSWETITAGQAIATATGWTLEAAVVGAASVAGEVAGKKVAKVYAIESPKLEPYTPDAFAAALKQFLASHPAKLVLMPHTYQVRDFVPKLATAMAEYRPLVEIPHARSETARRYRFEDGVGEIGIIAPVSHPFCGHCSRIRITSDGKIRTCLFSVWDHDLYAQMRRGASDAELAEFIRGVVEKKEERHHIGEPDFVPASRTMVHIGG